MTVSGEEGAAKVSASERPMPVVTCPVCDKRFVDVGACNIHIGKVHVEKKPSPIEERLDAIERRLLRVEHQFTPIGGGDLCAGISTLTQEGPCP